MRIRPPATLFLLAIGTAAHAAVTVTGTVFADNDHDGLYSAGDTPIPNCVVFFEKTLTAVTDGQGRYTLSVPGNGIVWARTPDGFRPTPSWRQVNGTTSAQTADLPLAPSAATGPVAFVQGSDTHIGQIPGAAATSAFAALSTLVPAPHFFTVTGDLTQSTSAAEFDEVEQALAGVSVPFVPVPGNHDWGDGGVTYRRYFGPPTYSFDAGGVHFVVLELPVSNSSEHLAFLDRDLAYVPPGTPIVAFTHFPPAMPQDNAFTSGLAARGVKAMFTGHWHQNRVLHYGAVTDYNESPMIMAGVDLTPGMWRVVHIDGGVVTMEPHTTVEAPIFRLVHPIPDDVCSAASPQPLIVDVEQAGGFTGLRVSASLDNGAPFPLDWNGGWVFSSHVRSLGAAGSHAITLTLDGPGVGHRELVQSFCLRDLAPPLALPDWPQLQGGPRHEGASPYSLHGPLRALWATSVGGHLRGGSPVLAANRLYVPVMDTGTGERGGVVALDAITGAVLWEKRFGRSVNNAPAVDSDTVVVAEDNGVVHGLDAATGAPLWTTDVAEGLPEASSNEFAAPTIADGSVFIGVIRNVAALDLRTGRVMWQKNPSSSTVWLDATYSAMAVDQGVAVGVFGRGYEGLVAYDAASGNELWRGPANLSLATSAAPIITGHAVLSGNSATDVYQLDLFDGRQGWRTRLDAAGFGWGYWISATPAYSQYRLIVPTQENGLHAVYDWNGQQAWGVGAQPSVLHPVHYQATSAAFTSSPVVTAQSVWIGGADGILRELDLASGDEKWTHDLGAPILSGVVPAGQILFVATWDGTVRALMSDAPSGLEEPSGCSVAVGTAGAAGGGAGLAGLLFGVAALAISLRRRRRRCCR